MRPGYALCVQAASLSRIPPGTRYERNATSQLYFVLQFGLLIIAEPIKEALCVLCAACAGGSVRSLTQPCSGVAGRACRGRDCMLHCLISAAIWHLHARRVVMCRSILLLNTFVDSCLAGTASASAAGTEDRGRYLL